MKLPLLDVHAAPAGPGTVAAAAPGAQALQWKLQMLRAQAGLEQVAHGQGPQGAPGPEKAHELESCGAPMLTGEAPAPRADRGAPAAPAEEPLPPHQRSEREAERAPVRLHVQSLPAQGLAVWLGIDGDAALVAQRASVALAGLRRNLQSATGERIASIVCNGVAVDPRPPSSTAPPAPTRSPLLKDSP